MTAAAAPIPAATPAPETARMFAERERAETEHLRAERLATRLRELGIDPDDGG